MFEQVLWRGWCLVEILKLMLGRDSEDEIWSRFVFEPVIWTQPSGPLCLWQCFEQVELSLHRLLIDNWYFLGNSKPTHEVQEKHLAKKIDVKYLYFFVFPFSRWKTIFVIFFEQSIEWSNKESYKILHFDSCSWQVNNVLYFAGINNIVVRMLLY